MNTLINSAHQVASGSTPLGVGSDAAAEASRQARIATRAASLRHSIGAYGYSKTKPNVVICPSSDGFKTLAATLAEAAGGTWTHRARGYLMSSRQLQKFNQSVSDASAVQIA